MKTIQEQKIKTFNEVLKDSELAELHDAIQYLHKTPFSKVFPKKHEMGLTDFALEQTILLFNENPYSPIKIALTTILGKITNEDISASLMLKLTKKIINKWDNLSYSFQQENQTAVAA